MATHGMYKGYPKKEKKRKEWLSMKIGKFTVRSKYTKERTAVAIKNNTTGVVIPVLTMFYAYGVWQICTTYGMWPVKYENYDLARKQFDKMVQAEMGKLCDMEGVE